jgi:aminoglycoside phosphotransferase (APT) family kinase protein
MRQAARLHAAFWNCGEDPQFAWLDTGRMAQPFYDASVLRGAWPTFRDRYGDVLTTDMIRVCDKLTERYEAYMAPLKRPRCVTHNDYRPDNMLFAPDGGVTVVDWQSAALGFNAVDPAYMIGGAFSPSARREAEAKLLDSYFRELAVQGVEGYTRADLEADYRHFSFAGINVAVGAAIMVKRTERGDRMFLTMLERHVAHVIDTGALSILEMGAD